MKITSLLNRNSQPLAEMWTADVFFPYLSISHCEARESKQR